METAALSSDTELLTDWLERGREPSFHALVSRYATLVHMAALRSCGNDTLAAEAAQLTFILLARKARSLTDRRSLAGWLHLTAVMQVKNLVRQTRRETRKRLQLLADMETDSALPPDTAAAWREMGPVLDEALASLADRDREALLLRFYRSLSVREIAATLGIATDAAQKRLDRATVRLRAGLIRRGCQDAGGGGMLTGASLAAVLLAGFAADSHAAVSGPAASAFASQALTASASATGSAGISTLAKLTALKTSSLLPPALALLLAAGWLVPKFTALAAVRKENHALDQHLADARIKAPDTVKSPKQKPNSLAVSLKAAQSLDWRELVALFAAKKDDPETVIKMTLATQEIQKKVQEMTKEELAGAFDKIIALIQPMEDKQADKIMMEFGQLLLPRLLTLDSRFALEYFAPLLKNGSRYGQFCWGLARALGIWAKSDMAAASAWLDGQIAAGSFDSKTLSGESPARFWFESEMMLTLLSTDPEEAARRLGTLDEVMRRQIIARATGHAGETGRTLLIDLARTRLQPENGARVIASMIPGTRSVEDLPKTAAFMEKINASPEERAACIAQAAEAVISEQIFRKHVKWQDLAGLRPWIIAQAPAEADTITGKVIGGMTASGGWKSFEELSELVSGYDRESGGEEVLASFLENCDASTTRAPAVKLAASLKDPTRRAEVLKHLELSPLNADSLK